MSRGPCDEMVDECGDEYSSVVVIATAMMATVLVMTMTMVVKDGDAK